MNIEDIRNHCIVKKGVEECFPFGEETLVFKVMGKVFLLTGINSKPVEFNVKCNPEKAISLRETYSCVTPGYHMNKKHWNTIICDGSVNKKIIEEWIDDSYDLVVSSLTQKLKSELKSM